MEDLMTKKELAAHWQVTTKAIENWINDGIITPCKKVPGHVRFSPKYIAELDGVPLEKHSPLEWRKVERELEYWRIRAKKSEEVLDKVNMITTEARYFREKKEI